MTRPKPSATARAAERAAANDRKAIVKMLREEAPTFDADAAREIADLATQLLEIEDGDAAMHFWPAQTMNEYASMTRSLFLNMEKLRLHEIELTIAEPAPAINDFIAQRILQACTNRVVLTAPGIQPPWTRPLETEAKS